MMWLFASIVAVISMFLEAQAGECNVCSTQKWKTEGCGKSPYTDAAEDLSPGGAAFQIIGGAFARPHEFPWQVYIETSTHQGIKCSGSLISECWVITTVFCVLDDDNHLLPPGNFTLYLGEHDATDSDYLEVRTGVKVIPHGEFDDYLADNDIALIKLNEPVVFNENLTNICPPSSQWYDGMDVTISGWGHTEDGTTSDVLKYTNLDVINTTYCGTIYPPEYLTDGMFCTWDPPHGNTTDSCGADRGGPVMHKDNATGCFELTGLVSWEVGCAEGYPGVNTDVFDFLDWIENC